jgi:hypothetical protein
MQISLQSDNAAAWMTGESRLHSQHKADIFFTSILLPIMGLIQPPI